MWLYILDPTIKHKLTMPWGVLVGRTLSPSVEAWEFESPVGSSQRLKNWHLLLPCLAFTIKGLEQSRLAHCQFKMTGWGIMFICGMVLWCALTLKHDLSLDQFQQI